MQPLPTTHEERIDILFNLSPSTNPKEIRSALGLLLQEYKRNKEKSIWSAAMCIMAGIDLMAKFYHNSDTTDVGARFKKYLNKIMLISKSDAEIIYALRNSFMHSFGLYNENKQNGKIFIHPRFSNKANTIVEIQTAATSSCGVKHYKVYIKPLAEKFETTIISELKPKLLSNVSIHNKFEELFNKYGTDKPLFEGNAYYQICGFNTHSA